MAGFNEHDFLKFKNKLSKINGKLVNLRGFIDGKSAEYMQYIQEWIVPHDTSTKEAHIGKATLLFDILQAYNDLLEEAQMKVVKYRHKLRTWLKNYDDYALATLPNIYFDGYAKKMIFTVRDIFDEVVDMARELGVDLFHLHIDKMIAGDQIEMFINILAEFD